MYPVAVDGSDLKNYASAFKSSRNKLQFMRDEFNEAHVKNNTDDSNLCVFLDADFDAQFDVNVLASAFNMDKANFIGRRFLIDDWTTFDNDRWQTIRENTISSLKGDTSGVVEEVTDEELALMADVHGVVIDERWFQIYDNLVQMEETKVSSGLYWNYFYHSWKTVAHSPFANALVFVDSSATITPVDSFELEVSDVSKVGNITVVNLVLDESTSLQQTDVRLETTEDLVEDGVGVQSYGSYLVSNSAKGKGYELVATVGAQKYTSSTSAYLSGLEVGTKITFQKES